MLQYRALSAGQLHWINEPPQVGKMYHARFRHRQALQVVTISHLSNDQMQVDFQCQQFAVAPGQSIVLYEDSRCLGGGVINDGIH